MLSLIWFTFLYQPLFNILIWLYSNVAGNNLGWAVVWLTVLLRVLLLPFTIISEFTALRHSQANDEAKKAMAAYPHDRIAQQAAVRKIMRKYHISPWAKVVSLGVQLLVFILLYQVFIGGINGQRVFKTLYQWIDFPGKINTIFYGFEIGRVHDYFWAGATAFYLLISIVIENKGRKGWDKSGMYFLLFFPLFTFVALWYLPMVKSIFILTTMIFSDIVSIVVIAVRWMFKPKEKTAH
ncbi:MAG: hypothetical protein EXS55_03870 [Candidatus Magasanikbacteria bacterium]|nr:hypothetical protein [Candidatus Magasanikbacteria bacterium]